MKHAILITHQFLEDSDLTDDDSWKLKVFKYVLKKYKSLNPKSYIVLVGHGKPIPFSISELVDWSYWHDGLVTNDINWGHPICVNIGIQHCEEKGISYVTKTRLDSINLVEEINSFCLKRIDLKNDQFIITSFDNQSFSIMDLFFSGKVESLKKLYEYNSWQKFWPDFTQQGGTYPLAFNYYKNILNKEVPLKFEINEWLNDLKKKIIIMSPADLKWLDLRKFNFLVDPSGEKLIIEENSKLIANFFWRH